MLTNYKSILFTVSSFSYFHRGIFLFFLFYSPFSPATSLAMLIDKVKRTPVRKKKKKKKTKRARKQRKAIRILDSKWFRWGLNLFLSLFHSHQVANKCSLWGFESVVEPEGLEISRVDEKIK